MQVMVRPGSYVAAVSGGVDSMVLLDLLRRRPGLQVTVAHLDHGIRSDSFEDRKLVQEVARQHNLPFVYHRAMLGPNVNEQTARQARYNFLEKTRKASGAHAIITAHHQNDVLETVIHNILRGTKRHGYSSLKSTDGILRPLLDYPKEQLIDYAHAHNLSWREDSTNQDLRYRRNYIRHKLLTRMNDAQKAQMRILTQEMHSINEEANRLLLNVLHQQPHSHKLDRLWFNQLPHLVAKEVLHFWLRQRGVANLNNKQIERLVVSIKTGVQGKSYIVNKHSVLQLEKLAIKLHGLTA